MCISELHLLFCNENNIIYNNIYLHTILCKLLYRFVLLVTKVFQHTIKAVDCCVSHDWVQLVIDWLENVSILHFHSLLTHPTENSHMAHLWPWTDICLCRLIVWSFLHILGCLFLWENQFVRAQLLYIYN